MEDFFDRSYYAALVCAGSDGSDAARQIERVCTGWRLRAVAEPLIVCTRAQTPEAILARVWPFPGPEVAERVSG